MLSIEKNNKVERVTKNRNLSIKNKTKEPKRFSRPVKRFPREPLPAAEYRIIVKKDLDPETIDKWLSTPPGWITALTEDMEGKPTKLYDYQSQGMIDPSIFSIVNKSRQTGFSFGESLKSLAKCHLKKLHTSIFISTTQEEANEKIRFAQFAYHSMPTEYQRKLIVENKSSLEFEYKRFRTRILSLPQRQPRGKGNNTDIVLDEFAHMMWANEIYISAVPVITRGTGTLRIGSTPLGKDCKFYEIYNDKEKYWRYSRLEIPWWSCPELCSNIEEARKLAPFMNTIERVNVFGNDKLAMIYDAMDEEDFQQEYELYSADTTLAYYPLELIKSCAFETNSELEDNIDPDEIKDAFSPVKEGDKLIIPDTIMNHYKKEHINWYYEGISVSDENIAIESIKEMIERLLLNMETDNFGRTLLFGMDIGRNKNSSEIDILEEIDIEQYNLQIERLSIELIVIPFRLQKEIVRLMLKMLPIKKAYIDGTKGSLGEDIAETLSYEFPQVVDTMQFDPDSKAKMAKNFRFRLEDRTIAIYNDSHSIKQIHSIKKTVTESMNIKYGADKTKKHHGDKFWAKALASIAGTEYDRGSLPYDNLVRMGNGRMFTPNDLQNSNTAIRIATNSNIENFKSPKIKLESSFDYMNTMFFDPVYHKV